MVHTTQNKNSQQITDEVSNSFSQLKRKLIEIEKNRGKAFYISMFQKFLRINEIHQFPRISDEGAPVAERLIRTIRKFFRKHVILKGCAGWLSELPAVITQYKKKQNLLIHRTNTNRCIYKK